MPGVDTLLYSWFIASVSVSHALDSTGMTGFGNNVSRR